MSRADRFRILLENIESDARKVLDGRANDIPMTLVFTARELAEAIDIAMQVSREALDEAVG